MKLRHAKTVVVGAVVLGSLMAALMIRHQAQAKLRQTEERIRQQDRQLAEAAAEHQRLSDLLSQAARAPAGDSLAELAGLRAEVGALRQRTNEMARQAENRRSADGGAGTGAITPERQPGNTWVVSDSDSGEYARQLTQMAAGERNRYTGDAQNLSWAVREFARQHNGEIPATFADVEPYKWKGKLPLAGSFKERDTMAGTADFEIVYHGSLNELTNIPTQTIAMIRQREPWQTPKGKWARIYTMADGRVCVIESDDNFQFWEAEHLIPPPTTGQ